MTHGGLVSLILTPAVLVLTGCQASGMGWLQSSAVPTEKATFGFVFDGTTGTFSGSYHDPQGMVATGVVEVDLKGTGVVREGPPGAGGAPCLLGTPTYKSQNRQLPGSGTLDLLVCDLGEPGVGSGDFISIQVLTGPYAGYGNAGVLEGGNIEAH